MIRLESIASVKQCKVARRHTRRLGVQRFQFTELIPVVTIQPLRAAIGSLWDKGVTQDGVLDGIEVVAFLLLTR